MNCVCLLCERWWRVTKADCRSLRARIGVILLLVNVPFGYSALAICGFLYVQTKNAFWTYLGGACYVLSWLMLVAGTYLTGKQVKDSLGKRLKRVYRSWRRFNKRKQK